MESCIVNPGVEADGGGWNGSTSCATACIASTPTSTTARKFCLCLVFMFLSVEFISLLRSFHHCQRRWRPRLFDEFLAGHIGAQDDVEVCFGCGQPVRFLVFAGQLRLQIESQSAVPIALHIWRAVA